MSEEDFIGGCKYFLQSIGPSRKSLIKACKRKYPLLNGRGVNFIMVPTIWLGDCWRWGAIVDPGRIHISKERLLSEEIFEKPMDAESLTLITNAIDDYDPNQQILWCFISNMPNGGGSSIQIFTSGPPQNKKRNIYFN